jgi:signal transduction histidine kinase
VPEADPISETTLPPSAQVLLDAVIAISSAGDMHDVLAQIVESSCELTDAQYGALGVIGDGHALSAFITHGISEADRERIGGLPTGRGILRLLIDRPEPIRIANLRDHPASYGFPPNHPAMASFLGVPVRIRGTVFGNLYLTEKRGGGEFTAQDELLVDALALAAGFVIENTRAYALSERQRSWLEASARLHESLQGPIAFADAMPHIAAGTRAVSGALAVGIFARDADQLPMLIASDGREANTLMDAAVLAGTHLDRAFSGHQADDLHFGNNRRLMVLPLSTHVFDSLALLVIVDAHQDETGRPVHDTALTRSFTDQASMALDRLQARIDRQELAVVSDRERIARDLHDVVIQRLFATGLQLQGIRAKSGSATVQERLDQAVLDLDTTIRDIRTTIFELQYAESGPVSLRHAVHALVGEYRSVLPFAPVLRTTGPVDAVVDAETREHTLAVLREALSNVAKHAAATSTLVEIEVAASELLLRVTDDGRGLPEARSESGLLNIRNRAKELGGAVRLNHVQPHGTALEWQVPLGSERGVEGHAEP